ncbi:hypothetical protein ACGFWF_18115 [Streptomyces sp. NPDC048581]|uniref:hypothetical protein n=1 Tax=Streptomyces sp. NPDC048581 TaxID=3365572 RepID=UPI003721B6A8
MGTRFDQVPLVGTGLDPAGDIDGWLASAPVRALVEAFSRTGQDHELARDLAAEKGDVVERLARLDAFTDRWDTRRGRERNQADELAMRPDQEELVTAAAEALGMCGGTRLRYDRYDHVLILGGLVRACLVRTAHAAQLIRSGQVTAGSVTALGGHRPFVGDEFELAAQAGAPELAEEYEAMDFGTRRAFGLGAPESVEGEESELPGGTWGVRHYRTADGMPLQVVAAPSSEPARRRADTPDSYAFFAGRVAALQPGERLLLVSTAIYVPAQHAAAVRMLKLPFGVEVDTVGNAPGAVAGMPPQRFTATKYLLEVRSTVRSLARLAEALS